MNWRKLAINAAVSLVGAATIPQAQGAVMANIKTFYTNTAINGRFTQVTLTIDLDAAFLFLGSAALRNKSHKAREMGGIITATVRDLDEVKVTRSGPET